MGATLLQMEQKEIAAFTDMSTQKKIHIIGKTVPDIGNVERVDGPLLPATKEGSSHRNNMGT